MATVRKPTDQIKPGDIIRFLNTHHMVTAIEPYEGVHDFIIGIARAEDGWGISLEAGRYIDVEVA